jgi:hypothetical protein
MRFGSGFRGFSCSRICVFCLLFIFVDALHDERNAGDSTDLRDRSPCAAFDQQNSDLGYLVWSDSILLH